MLYGIGDINLLSIDPCFLKGAIHNFSGRPNKWFTGHVFVVALVARRRASSAHF